jgi:ABC-2 type transport system ATP-binding protein
MIYVKNIQVKLKNKVIIKDISFSLEKGEVLGVIGQNGAGKSTLLKALVGLIKPNSGIIQYSFDDKNIKKNIGFAIEEPALYSYFTAKEHIDVCLKLYGLEFGKYQKMIIKDLEVDKFIDKKINSYSQGMKQRLSIVSAICHNPKLIVLDEPTNSLDITGIQIVRELILKQKNEGKSFIVSSHILSEIEKVCDKILIIEKGSQIETININEINNLEKHYIERRFAK